MSYIQAEQLVKKRCAYFNINTDYIQCTQLVDYGNYYIIYANINNNCRKFPVYKSAI